MRERHVALGKLFNVNIEVGLAVLDVLTIRNGHDGFLDGRLTNLE